MKLHLTAAALALAFAGSAYAATTSTDAINPNSVSDNTNNSTFVTGAVSTTGSTIGNFTIDQYNSGGVLTGASFSALVGSENLRFTSTSCQSCVDGSASAYRTGTLDIAGISAVNSSATVGVTGVTGLTSKSQTSASYTVSGSATTQAQLDALYGTGTLSGTVKETLSISKTDTSARTLTVDNKTANNSGDSNATAGITYSYTALNHANGSFGSSSLNNDTLNLSFNSVLQNSSPTSLNFDLYNLLGSYGLQVVSVSGGSGPFSLTGLAGTGNLGAGSFVSGTVGLNTSVAGTYNSTWYITVADSAAGIGAGKNLTNTNVLTLNVGATVTPVPEPGSYAMLLAGLSVMGFVARRRQRQS